ncbi:MAG: hypothetical protein OXH79_11625 [Boseongicola sp.]|nr:hypothetical protein [Boseongicola sp.]
MRLHEVIDDYFDEVLKKKISESDDLSDEEVLAEEIKPDPEIDRLKVLAGISKK